MQIILQSELPKINIPDYQTKDNIVLNVFNTIGELKNSFNFISLYFVLF